MSTPEPLEAEPLLSPGETAELLHVDSSTVLRWANTGKLHAIRTPGGHRRYREAEVHALRSQYGSAGALRAHLDGGRDGRGT
jgi:excisionase family DNA binding protein